MVRPAAVMKLPGAHIVSCADEFEKHATWPAVVVASEHTPAFTVPKLPSYSAPTERACGAHAGDEMALSEPLFPLATTGTMPAARARPSGAAKTSVGHAAVKRPPPRLKLSATTL